MFTPEELQAIAGALRTEAEFLRTVERHGIPTVRQAAQLAVLEAKVVDLLDAAAKASAPALPAEGEPR